MSYFIPLCLKSELSLWQTEVEQKGTWLNLWKKHGNWVQATCDDLGLPRLPAIGHPKHVTRVYLAAFSLSAKQGSTIFYSTSVSQGGMSPACFETLINSSRISRIVSFVVYTQLYFFCCCCFSLEAEQGQMKGGKKKSGDVLPSWGACQ